MPRIKPKRSTPRLDMTPMVDLAFLLVTFFMLTTQFRPDEAVAVDVPPSTANLIIQDKDLLTITVSREGGVYLDMSTNKDQTDQTSFRVKWAQKMDEDYKIGLTDAELNAFAYSGSFGFPLNQFKNYLDASGPERKALNTGVQVDTTTTNELSHWVLNARLANPNLQVAIKGDRDSDYKVFKNVVNTIKEPPLNVKNFSLITSLAAGPDNK
jgi:biopolymer transport protein ExbD